MVAEPVKELGEGIGNAGFGSTVQAANASFGVPAGVVPLMHQASPAVGLQPAPHLLSCRG